LCKVLFPLCFVDLVTRVSVVVLITFFPCGYNGKDVLLGKRYAPTEDYTFHIPNPNMIFYEQVSQMT
jgi:hypothetical protein